MARHGTGAWQDSPVFAAQLRACADALRPFLDWSLLDVLLGAPDAPSLDRVDVIQPALFSVMVSLAAVWQSYGIKPAAVIGHSQGEIAGAYVAGGLTLEDAAHIVALRSRLWAELDGKGGMMAVSLPADEARERLERWGDRLSIAAVNGPRTVTVSGEPAALDALLAELEAEGVRARRVRGVDTAGHSAQVEVLRERMLSGLRTVTPLASRIPFYSTVTGGRLDRVSWTRSTGTGTSARRSDSKRPEGPCWLPAAPGSSSAALIRCCRPRCRRRPRTQAADIAVVGSLRRQEGGAQRLLTSLAEAAVRGIEPDWEAVFARHDARRVALPTYAFQRELYWLSGSAPAADVTAAGLAPAGHPLLGAAIALAGSDSYCSPAGWPSRHTPWLAHHAVLGTPLLPGTAFVELAFRAGDARRVRADGGADVEAPLALPALGAVASRCGRRGRGRPQDARRCSRGRSRRAGRAVAAPCQGCPAAGGTAASFDLRPGPGRRPVSRGGWPARTGFRGLRALWRLGEEVFAEVRLTEDTTSEAGLFGLHPALLEAALHKTDAAGHGNAAEGADADARLACAWKGVALHATGASGLRVRLTPTGPDGVSVEAADPQRPPRGDR